MTKRDDLVFRIVEFDDDIQPSAALVSDDLDANSYQDRAWRYRQQFEEAEAAYAESSAVTAGTGCRQLCGIR